MDPDIRDALAGLKSDVRDGFSAVNKRIDDLVTKSEFNATIARVDAQHETLRRDHETHDVAAQQVWEANRRADAAISEKAEQGMETIRKSMKSEINTLRTDMHAQLGKVSSTAKWAVGLATTFLLGLIGTSIGVVSWLQSI